MEEEFDIPMTRQMEMEVEYMCNLSDGVEARGIEKGIKIEAKRNKNAVKNAVLSNLKSLMETTNWSIDEALAALKIPESQHKMFREKLNAVK